jgi:signal transduction histidine kinase
MALSSNMEKTDKGAASAEEAQPRSSLVTRHLSLKRVGFWRSMLELTLVLHAISALIYLLYNALPSSLVDLTSYAAMGLYCFAAWRLEPGQGRFWRRAGRIVAWLLISSLINGTLGWLIIELIPIKGRVLGMRIEDVQVDWLSYTLAALVLTAGLFVPVRALLSVRALGRQRLRWQLTFSYLLIGVLTSLFVPLLVVFYIAILSLAPAPPITPPMELARRLADALGPEVRNGVSPGQLNSMLDAIMEGQGRLPMAASEEVDEQLTDLKSNQVRRLTLLSIEGLVLASSGREAFTSGQPLPEQSAAQMGLLLAAAREQGCANARPAEGILADTSACMVNGSTASSSVLLLVESEINSAMQVGAMAGRIIQITLLGASVTLNVVVFVFLLVLPVALGAGYLLARRLTRRLERLTAATGDIATGNYDRRVEIDSQDELGRLSSDFNRMAARLEERERALEDAAAQAENLLRTNKRLVADVSHELRNPLATLRGYLEALEQSHGDKLPNADLHVIRNETQRLTTLVEDLFTVARAEAQQLPLTMTMVDVGVVARNLATTLAPLARREREIELVTDIPTDLPLAYADQARFEQILRNLAQNALRYTPPGGIVIFAARAEPEQVVISVADTGAGIAAEELPLVFERFYRGDSSRARETGGAGLGLSLVKELISAMGGTVIAESEVGRGSVFQVRLRRSDE